MKNIWKYIKDMSVNPIYFEFYAVEVYLNQF